MCFHQDSVAFGKRGSIVIGNDGRYSFWLHQIGYRFVNRYPVARGQCSRSHYESDPLSTITAGGLRVLVDLVPQALHGEVRSAERRVGKEVVDTCSSWCAQVPYKKNN